MQCAACGTDNDAGSKFCMTCGAPQENGESTDATPPPSGEHEAAPIPSHDLSSMAGAGSSADASADSPTAPAGWGTAEESSLAADGAPAAAPDDTPAPPSSGEAPGPAVFAPPPPPDGPPAPGGFAPPPPPGADPGVGGYQPPPPMAPPAQAPAGAPPTPGGYPPPAADQAWGQAAAPAPAWGAPGPGAPPEAPAPGAQPPAWGQPAPGGPPGPGYGPPAGGQGFAPPGGPGFQQQAPAAPAGPPDPNGLGAAAGRLGNRPRKDARSAFAVAGAVLQDGELVEALAAGKFEGNAALLVLTDRAVLLVDDRPWKPTVERISVDGGLQVQGWQDDRTASLTLVTASRQMVLESIADRPLAVEMAQRIRYRTGS